MICDDSEHAYRKELYQMSLFERTTQASWAEQHRFLLMKLAYVLFQTLFMSKVETVTLMVPHLSALLLSAATLTLLVIALASIPVWITPLFLLAGLIGSIDGSVFTSFLFLAITKTDLPCDMQLYFRERELVVNLLLMSKTLTRCAAYFAGYLLLSYLDPQLLYNQP